VVLRDNSAMHFDQLGPYRLGKKLGQGGMGSVYEGLDVANGQAAAVKVLSPTLAAEEGFRVRFEAEIESLKKLRHPNIVRLLGYGEQSGTLFYAMELVPGTSLEEELRRGKRFEWREVTQIAIKLCKALKHAHDHGVIHRDLKPANLLLTTDGDVKLSDFGIARLFGNTHLTADGGVLGTAEYMAPEQASGGPITDRCDQYSLGGVLYALLAGRPPFRAKSLVEMLQLQRYSEPEPVTRYAPQTPAELARIVHQLLEKEPQKRFANTLMLSRALEAMERGLSIATVHDDDFVLAPSTDVSLSAYNPQAPTMTPAQLDEARRQTPDDMQATEVTMAFSADAPQLAGRQTVEPSEPGAATFIKVDTDRAEHSGEFGESLARLLSFQTLAFAAALVALGWLGWYLMQPPTADELYRQIEVATAEGDADSLKAARPKIEKFLDLFPDDPRAAAVQSMQDELKQAHPIQRAYTEAKRSTLINPELALAKLDALIALYDDGDDNSEVARHYVKLAQRERTRVQKQVDRHAAEGRKLIESRLAKAAQLANQQPEASRKIYAGVVELYADKPWAADQVARARAALAAEPTTATATESAAAPAP